MVREHLEKAPLADADERRGFVIEVLSTGKVSSWRRGEKTEPGTVTGAKRLKEYARLVLANAADLGLDPSQEQR
jgi:hypothetical protein